MVVNKTRILVAAAEGATYTVLSPASAELTIRSDMQNYYDIIVFSKNKKKRMAEKLIWKIC